MAKEIERKFLVRNDSYKKCANRQIEIQQTYLSVSAEAVVRLRIAGDTAYLTVKSKNHGCQRGEWEYSIPVAEAREMMAECACSPLITKTRYIAGRWEIDEFHGSLQGLTVAEIELSDPDEPFVIPDYIGKEVTGDTRYYNSSLSENGEIPPLV